MTTSFADDIVRSILYQNFRNTGLISISGLKLKHESPQTGVQSRLSKRTTEYAKLLPI